MRMRMRESGNERRWKRLFDSIPSEQNYQDDVRIKGRAKDGFMSKLSFMVE